MNRVQDKVAIVTGGARGMGAMFARKLFQEGARVALTDILAAEGEALARELGGGAMFLQHDVRNAADWTRVVAETEAAFGPVNVLVNNAGIATYGAIEVLEESDLRHTLDINLIGVFLGMKSVVASMRRAKGGAIINISSIAGMVGTRNMTSYTASKFAVRGITKVAALEFSDYGIRVNSIHPGLISTPMTQGLTSDKAIMDAALVTTPAGRMAQPEEVANVVLLLASDETRFATGAEFVIDGGYLCQ
jgi:3alpha(or 20beta)-hydroxysteroid dehydrogenase